MRKISIVIPVFNEAKNISGAIAAVDDLFRSELQGYACEIIITDNASTDESWSIIQMLASGRPELRAFRFSRNFGYQNSIFAGLTLATGHAVVELDADLEDPPAVIAKFVKHWEEGFEVVYGVRAKRFTPAIYKLLFFLFYRMLNFVSDIPIPANSGDFRLLDRKVVDVLVRLPERNLYLRGLISFLGFKQKEVVYDRQPRLSGKSKFRFFQYLVLAVDALTAFSKTPLRLIGVLGAFLFVMSAGLAFYYLIGFLLHGTPVPGFTTMVVLMLVLNSITFIFLGVLGEYLSRIFDDSKFRPRVVVSEAINATDYPTSI
jgi:polyisoprenyl-phosphate glycosyltransferase